MFQDLKLRLRDDGFITTNIPASKDSVLRTALQRFLELPLSERMQYSQKKLGVAFDGYSYMGQTDSLNQYDKDLLHSFVLSDISTVETFPETFQEYLKQEFPEQLAYINALEKKVLHWLGVSELDLFYDDYIKQMVSCNYYPALALTDQKTKPLDRLSFHTDVSLFSVFLFGLESGFAYEKSNGKKVLQNAIDEVVLFPGCFMELMTNGKIKALNHGVILPENSSEERFSFAFFSIPEPRASIQHSSFTGSGKAYYEYYLNKF
ncbi:2OG-Fe(II) oxygenase family protein [Maribacter chungangensis]|uniref:2OG-Fe(II) oxygenase family protein n=1 Tax=Maribacter chungangensis TaxID=1069117 RepID=A0ABW3B7D4_9FLAO